MAQQKDINETHQRGRLVKDAETKMVGTKSLTKFTLATNFSKDKNKTEFHNVEAWGSEVAANLRKGTTCEFWGYVHQSSWLDSTTGKKRYGTTLVATKFVDAPLQPATASPKLDYIDDSEIPF